MKNIGLQILGVITLVVVVMLIGPAISFWICYFSGWLAKIVFGTTLANALNTLFGTTRFTPDMLPLTAGALGWIGGFFKNIKNTKGDK